MSFELLGTCNIMVNVKKSLFSLEVTASRRRVGQLVHLHCNITYYYFFPIN